MWATVGVRKDQINDKWTVTKMTLLENYMKRREECCASWNRSKIMVMMMQKRYEKMFNQRPRS